jgi:hypothetical protein
VVFLPGLGDVDVCPGMAGAAGRRFLLDGHLADVFLGCDFGGDPAPSVALCLYDSLFRYRGNGLVGGPPFDFLVVVPQGELCLASYLERHGCCVDPGLLRRIGLGWRKG